MKTIPAFNQSGMTLVGVSALLFACKGTLIKFLFAQGATVADIMLLRMLFALPVYGWVGIVYAKKEFHALTASHFAGAAIIGIAGYYLASCIPMPDKCFHQDRELLQEVHQQKFAMLPLLFPLLQTTENLKIILIEYTVCHQPTSHRNRHQI